MDSFKASMSRGSNILPEETPPKFFARHLSAYYFTLPYVTGKDILEIGFGDGYGSNFLAKHVKRIEAIDVTKENVIHASEKYKSPNLKFREMDAVNLNFESGSFDIVISFQVIEHIAEDHLVRYLEEIKRVLRKGGCTFISTLNLGMNKKPNRPYSKNPFHIKEFSYEEFDMLIRKVFDKYDIYGLFYGIKLGIYERLKKIGIFKFLPKPLNFVSRFYNNITEKAFVWRQKNLHRSIDFMAVCKKT